MSARSEYISRINRVIDHIESHMDQELRLETLSQVACFSPFHFHRIFKGIMGETLNQFIQRVRVEKAAAWLLSNPNRSVTEIALDSGFSGSAAFARAFKQHFGVSATQWRENPARENSKNGKIKSNLNQSIGKNGKALIQSSSYIDPVTNNLTWRIQMIDQKELKIEVKELPGIHVA